MGAKTLFTDLNFHIDQGEKVGLIGRNGQGKTTLLQIIGGIDNDYQGVINTQKNLKIILTKSNTLTLVKMSFTYWIADFLFLNPTI